MDEVQILGAQIKHISDKFKTHINHKLKDLDLTFSQLSVLLFLVNNQERKITQKDIGETLELKHSTVIGLLKRLEAKDLVQCVVDCENKRFRNVFLTEKAVCLEKEIHNHCSVLDERLIKNLTVQEQEQLRELLDKVISGLSEE